MFNCLVTLPTHLWLTPVSIINIHELLPAVVLDDTDEGILELWAKLENKLVGCLDREAWCYEADVESPTERREHVDGPSLIKSKYGIDALGELWADWKRREKVCEGRTRWFLREVTKIKQKIKLQTLWTRSFSLRRVNASCEEQGLWPWGALPSVSIDLLYLW